MDDSNPLVPIVEAIELLAGDVERRWLRLATVGQHLEALVSRIEATGWPAPGLGLAILGIIGIMVAARFWRLTLARLLRIKPDGDSARLKLIAMGFGLAAAVLVIQLVSSPGPIRRALLLSAAGTVLGMLAFDLLGWIMARRGPAPGLRRFTRIIAAAILWALAGAGILAVLRQFTAALPLRDAVGTFLVALPVTILLIIAYWRERRAVSYTIVHDGRLPDLGMRLAMRWPAFAIGLVIVAFLLLQIFSMREIPIGAGPTAFTLVLLLLLPFIDVRIARWARSGLDGDRIGVSSVAARRSLRLAVATIIIALVLIVWARPVATLLGVELTLAFWLVLELAGILLIAAYFWNLIGVAVDRSMGAANAATRDHHDSEELSTPRSRLGTILPLTAGVAKSGILALAVLSALLALGVNVWPFITGLSVFGLAISFGSQTLVKDIISGLFFLADDAFRLGEYVETSSAKGTVEKISIRSISLRNPRGPLATIPYGQIGKLINHSRDWVIVKMVFRVAFDTDAEMVRKLFKKIGQDLMADPELAQDLLEPFKGQGIGAVEDGTLLIRAKFKARAGRQFAARKAILAAVHRAFRENGIQTSPRPLLLPENG
ncbi:mechanosensitive ion channel domain-containing protein [Rhabdaerophilum sp. SD176]|uniref:mechanosensitive ion channel family protein n=1 Tax=Rhabdaerophilum sp. SD176 TaxID=2983548 RepID=UPI0024DF3D72|nr:mechanosensitive ion channel domain-containing protein [Rhabdaerophilum sp. SD176]